MIGIPCISDHFHGVDGLGDVPHLKPGVPDVNMLEMIQKEHAAVAICRLVNENPGNRLINICFVFVSV